MTIDKIQFTYSAYVQWLKLYHKDKIGELLKQHCMLQNPAAYTTMEELGFEKFTEGCWTMAGEMILNNDKIEIIEPAT